MAKEINNKQLTELSDENLKQVTGGLNLEEERCYPKTSFEGGACPSYFADKGDKCCIGGMRRTARGKFE